MKVILLLNVYVFSTDLLATCIILSFYSIINSKISYQKTFYTVLFLSITFSEFKEGGNDWH